MTCAVPIAAPPFGKLRSTHKDGHSRGKQTYRCRDCHYRFTPQGNRHYFPEATKRRAVDLYAEGTGITAASRVLGVKPATVFSWVKKARRSWDLMGRMTRLRAERQPGMQPARVISFDEMWTCVGARRREKRREV